MPTPASISKESFIAFKYSFVYLKADQAKHSHLSYKMSRTLLTRLARVVSYSKAVFKAPFTPPLENLPMTDTTLVKNTSKRGFASMDPQRQREIASLGGKAAHASGKAHEFNSSEAREAGRKGGRAGRRNADASGNSPSQN
jgi:general stress protein YciG